MHNTPKTKPGAPLENRNAKTRPGPQIGSQNAKKDNPATSHIHIRCTPAEKAAVVHAANGQKLSEYIRKKIGL